FVAINCAAIPETLIESELFGFERGAFTGAHKQTPGKIESANRGTLFLDELGDMPLSAQAKLLRFMQERCIERIGGRTEIPVDVRVVCATNRDLRAMIAEGTFREDLYFRMAETEIVLPPLRERGEDKLLLARNFLARFAEEYGSDVVNFDDGAIAAIESYNWPGNVRELMSKIKHGVVMADRRFVSAADMGLKSVDAFPNLREARDRAERSAVLKALTATGGRIAAASRLLGITRPTMYDLIKRHGIDEAAGRGLPGSAGHNDASLDEESSGPGGTPDVLRRIAPMSPAA
ncbi:MAG: sigma 54-interacting transcriptional regulator, partial [Pseudomonadales bacterium]|nr:sigma 54-interacting transcriptional regulator [Pseudomonadales bacterium]